MRKRSWSGPEWHVNTEVTGARPRIDKFYGLCHRRLHCAWRSRRNSTSERYPRVGQTYDQLGPSQITQREMEAGKTHGNALRTSTITASCILTLMSPKSCLIFAYIAVCRSARVPKNP